MASLKAQRNRHSYSRIQEMQDVSVSAPPPPKRLQFDSGDEVSSEATSSEVGRRLSFDIRKKIDFGSSDEDESKEPVPFPDDNEKEDCHGCSTLTSELKEPDLTPMTPFPQKVPYSTSGSNDFDLTSPPRTRSGRIYQNSQGSVSPCNKRMSTQRPVPLPVNLTLNLLRSDIKQKEGVSWPPAERHELFRPSLEDVAGTRMPIPELKSPCLTVPPPLHHDKRPISRISLIHHREEKIGRQKMTLMKHTYEFWDDITPKSKKLRRALHSESSATFQAPPVADPSSPPTNGIQSLKLLEGSPDLVHSPVSLPRPRALFEKSENLRRFSAPGNAGPGLGAGGGDASLSRKRRRIANVNPFSITPSVGIVKRQNAGNSALKEGAAQGGNASGNMGTPQSQEGIDMEIRTPAAEREGTAMKLPLYQSPMLPGKRIKVTDINISRFYEEFLEIDELACGVFGTVVLARHRLDGVVYAIKISKHQIHGHTHEERVAMNEVFAHSALIKHKHVVRYYNSWVENGRVYIQNEYCEGGSLGNKLRELRSQGKRFSEAELKKILHHVAKGLQYIHSKGLVHLDIKPENIFISLEHNSASSSPSLIDDDEELQGWAVVAADVSSRDPKAEGMDKSISDVTTTETAPQLSKNTNMQTFATPTGARLAAATPTNPTKRRRFSGHDSTDSGNVSDSKHFAVAPMDDGVSYKIGDLGHVVPVEGDQNPEEGDSRYMAPELLLPEIRRKLLYKSDVFSLGLSLFEAASLVELPKNTLDSPVYEFFKAGEIPVLEGYSKEFNKIIKAMVNPDPVFRPSVARLVTLGTGRNSNGTKSRSQLYKELRDTRAKLQVLEQELGNEKNATDASASPAFPTPPKEEFSDSASAPTLSTGIVLRSSTTKTKRTGSMKKLRTPSKPLEGIVMAATPRLGKRTNLRKRTLVKPVVV